MNAPKSSGAVGLARHSSSGYAGRPERWFQMSLAMLTFVTGLVDAVGYLALGHVFTANMTGNVVLLGFAAARTPGLSVVRSMTALVFAFVGGVCAGRLEKHYRPRGRAEWLSVVGSVETTVLVIATLVALRVSYLDSLAPAAVLALIGLTSLSMGIRNATVRHLGVADITTTVLTLTVAGLSSESSLGGGTNPRWGRRVTAIASMLMGALFGALLLRFSIAAALSFGAILTAVATGIHRIYVPDEVAEAHTA